MRIDSSGNVGIGTSSPGTQLEIAGSASTLLRLDSSNGNGGVIRIRNSGTDKHFFGSAADFITGGAADQTAIRSNSSILFGISGNEKVRIDSSGNVGIGTTSAQAKLDVRTGATGFAQFGHASGNGGVRITGEGGSSNANLVFSNNRGVSTSDEYTIQLSGADDALVFRSGGPADTERMRIDSSGNVGIGTTSPGAKLHATGEIRFGSNVSYYGSIDHDAASTGANIYNSVDSGGHIFKRNNTIEQMRILSGGGITFNGDTAQANALGDYEEGTFTPNYAGATTAGTYTYATRTGHYTKIGDMVNVTIKMTNITDSTEGAGEINITGLPFTSANNASFVCGSVVLDNFNTATGTVSLAVRLEGNSTAMDIRETRDNDTDAVMTVGDRGSDAADIFCTITYRV